MTEPMSKLASSENKIYIALQAGSANFANAREAMASPLAKKLMVIDGVTGVFFGGDFVTVTKSEGYTWPMLKPDIFAGIMDHFSSGAHPA